MQSKNYCLRQKANLLSYNSFGLNSTAEIVCYPYNDSGIAEIYRDYPEATIVVLGNGTNVLFSKTYYDNNYVFLSMKLMDSLKIENDSIIAESGVSLNRLAWFAVERGIDGFEFLEDVPGSVGGAVIMNAGTYSDNISQILKSVTYYSISKNTIISAEKEELDFHTRGSLLSLGDNIVLRVQFVSKKRNDDNYLSSVKRILEIKENRYTKQPRNYPSAGSVFKRPVHNGKQEEVWRLVNDVGLRGYRIGGAEISEKHTGFIVNLGSAKYEDIEGLIQLIKDKVYTTYSITLEEEVKRI